MPRVYKIEINDKGRTCTECGEFKDWSEFHRLKRGSHGRQSKCRACRNAIKRAWYEENVERVAAYNRERARGRKRGDEN